MDNFLYLPRALASILFDIPFSFAFGSLFAFLWLRHLAPKAGPSMEAWDSSPMSTAPPMTRALHPSPHHNTCLRRTLILATALMLLALPIHLWLLTATMLASSSPADIRPQLYDVLTGIHAGRILIPAFLCALLLLLSAPFIAPLPHAMSGIRTSPGAPSLPALSHGTVGLWSGTTIRFYPCLTLAFLLAAFRSASGHAAANGSMSLSEVVQFLHLTSIAIWSGGIMVAGWLVLPGLPDLAQLTTFGRRLSTTATVAIVFVALSGVYNAWLGLDGSLKPLPHTQWGLILTAKSAFVLTALALGARNRSLLARDPVLTLAGAKAFRRSMQVEAAVMAVILILSGFLANSPPATGQ